MTNKGIDEAVLAAVEAGIRFQKDIVRKLELIGVLGVESVLVKDRTVGNSLRRLKAAGKVKYISQKTGWSPRGRDVVVS